MATSAHGREQVDSSDYISATHCHAAAARIQRAVGLYRDPDALFPVVARELRSVVKAHTIGVVHYDDFEGAIQWYALDMDGSSPSVFPFTPWEGSACHWVYESQQPLLLELTTDSSPLNSFLDYLTQFGIVSACILPLTAGQRRLGAVILASQGPGYFSLDMVPLLAPIANQVALALDGAFNFAALQIARARLEYETTKLRLLLDLNNAIVSDLELTTLVQQISPRIRGLMHLDAVALILPDSENSALHLHALDFPGRKAQQPQTPEWLQRNSIAGEVFHSGKPWIGGVKIGGQKPMARPDSQDLEAISGLKSLCVLPLIRRNRVLGVLGLGRLQETAFAQSDVDFLLQVAKQVAIAVENALEYSKATTTSGVQVIHEKSLLEDEIEDQIWDRTHLRDIVGRSPALRRVLQQVETIAPTECTVLLCGETGTGKELVARAIHDLSSRSGAAFVRVNCAALPAGLLESELFGHERGAFTGALTHRIGRFELANDGTIFLDEISELPLELQPKLLRVLQEREFERLGSSRTLRINTRLIAATNRDLKSMVSEQKFRADLFYRLNVVPLELPPLRERREDIPLLATHFTQLFSENLNKKAKLIPPETMDGFIRYQWPGNIRELQNVIERAVILSDGPILKVPLSELTRDTTNRDSDSWGTTLEEVERRHILSVLKDANWVFSGPHGAAARLGIKRSTLQFRIKKLGISRPN
jgi:formate hydrogenlyase transcriptional activator